MFKKLILLLMMSLVVSGWCSIHAETVTNYKETFNERIFVSNHDFIVDSSWKHIVDSNHGDDFGPYYMGYNWESKGLNDTGTLVAYKQYAGDDETGAEVFDLLVTPEVSGNIKIYVKEFELASKTNPSFVEFYEVDDTGTTRGELIARFTADNYVEDDDNWGWGYISYNVASARRIGIRAQYVYLEDFTAQSAEIVEEPRLTIVSVSSEDGDIYYPSQNSDGTTDITVKVGLKNTGDVILTENETSNFSLSLVKKEYIGSEETIFDNVKCEITGTLGIGEQKEYILTFKAPAEIGTGWMYIKVKENVSGTISSSQMQTQIKEYASNFIFDKENTVYNNNSTATGTPIVFGKISQETSLNYEIYNSGKAPLAINSITLPEHFTSDAPESEFTLLGGEKKVITITLPATETGVYGGNLEIAYTNFGKTMTTYTLAVSGTVIDPSKNMITFDNGSNGQFPAGSVHSDYVYISSMTVDDVTNWYLQGVPSNVTKFITPLLTAEAGEIFTYDTWYNGTNAITNCGVNVYISSDRINWTKVDGQTYNSGIRNTPKTYSVTIQDAGDYYLAFELVNNALLDNIYGLDLAEAPEHDWYVVAQNIPETGRQNAEYTATISLKNISAEDDEVENATLFVGGEAVATLENIALPGNNKTAAVGTGRNNYSNIESPISISLSFKPHTFGTLPAYIELKSGDNIITTNVVDITIAQEEATSELAVGKFVTTTSNQVPFYGIDMEKGAYADLYYSKAQLLNFGLKSGDVITAITFKGTVSKKTIKKLKAEAWVGLETDGSFVAGNANTDSMTHVVIYNDETVAFNSPVEMTIDLSGSPITYDGESELRIYTSMNGNNEFVSVAWQLDNNYPQQAYYSKSNTTWNQNYCKASPVAYLTLAVTARTLTGVVTDQQGNYVANATVTIRNDENDVEYSAVTDEEGKYTISVIQDTLTYTAKVAAEGYETLVDDEELDFSEENQSKDYSLTKVYLPLVVQISKYGYSTFYYSNSAYTIPPGMSAYIVLEVRGKALMLSALEDVIPAGCAVILEGEQSTEYTLEPYTSAVTKNVENMLLGTDEETFIEAEEGLRYYVLSVKDDDASKVGFYFGAEDGGSFTNEAHKAYLVVPSTISNGINAFFFDNATNSIGKAILVNEDGVWYSLDGRKLGGKPTNKGIYINNGNKLVIK